MEAPPRLSIPSIPSISSILSTILPTNLSKVNPLQPHSLPEHTALFTHFTQGVGGWVMLAKIRVHRPERRGK